MQTLAISLIFLVVIIQLSFFSRFKRRTLEIQNLFPAFKPDGSGPAKVGKRWINDADQVLTEAQYLGEPEESDEESLDRTIATYLATIPTSVLRPPPTTRKAKKADFAPIPIIEVEKKNISPAFATIVDGINRYIKRTRGLIPDIRTLESLTDRISDSVETDVSAHVAVPLYVGLMGTFLGVGLGLVSIAFGRSIDDKSVRDFLGGVLISMIGSFGGLLLTVVSSSCYLNRARRERDARKQAFFFFLQTDLLPVSGTLANSLEKMQTNLARFNADFTENIEQFKTSISAIGENTKVQKEFLEKLQEIGFNEIVSGNLQVLKELKESGDSLLSFVDATKTLEGRIAGSTDLADKVQNIMNRVAGFEQGLNYLGGEMRDPDGPFALSRLNLDEVVKEIEAIQTRKQSIEEYFAKRDKEIRKLIDEDIAKIARLVENNDTVIEEVARRTEKVSEGIEGEARAKLEMIRGETAKQLQEIADSMKEGKLLHNLERLKPIEEELKALSGLLEKTEKAAQAIQVTLRSPLRLVPGSSSPRLPATREHTNWFKRLFYGRGNGR